MFLQGCSQTGVKVGKPAPEFEITALGGEQLSIARLHDNYVLLYFWATWCDPCRAENAPLMEVFEKFQDAKFENGYDFRIMGIALDSNESDCRRIIREDKLRIRHHILDNSVTGNIFDAPLAKLYGIKKLPTRILLDGNGVVLGVDLSVEELEQLLRSKLLKN